MDNWILANIHMGEAQRAAHKERLILQAISANKPAKLSYTPSLRNRFDTLKSMLLCYGESFYCRTLSFIYSRTN